MKESAAGQESAKNTPFFYYYSHASLATFVGRVGHLREGQPPVHQLHRSSSAEISWRGHFP